jgi:hypothetical protein
VPPVAKLLHISDWETGSLYHNVTRIFFYSLLNHKYDLCSDETWMLNKPQNSFMQPMKGCLPWWTATDATHNCMPGCESILVVTASWLICLCVDFVYVVSEVEGMVVFRDEGTFEPTTELLSREARPICWHRRSCEFTVLDIFWSYVTVCICIWPFGILLIEGLTEIEYVLRPVYIWDCTQHTVVIPFHLFGITNRSHLQGSKCPRSTQHAHTGCLLEELTLTVFI